MKRKFYAFALLLIFLTQLSPVVVKADEVDATEISSEVVEPISVVSDSLEEPTEIEVATESYTNGVTSSETNQEIITESEPTEESSVNTVEEAHSQITTPETEVGETKIDESGPKETEADTEDLLFSDDKSNEDALKDFTGVVRQSEDFTCGPAALATLLTQIGEETSEQEVLEHISEISEEKGVSLLSLKIAAQALGQNVILKKWSSEQVLDFIQTTGNPVLIHDEKENVGGHYSVLREYNVLSGRVTLSDTEAGNIEYSRESFDHVFKGYVLIVGTDAESLDEANSVSDEQAAEIFGKYVPVYMAIIGDKQTKKDISKFKKCISSALKIQDKVERDTAREKCYQTFATALDGMGLSISEELALITTYTLGANTPMQDISVGYQTLSTALNLIMSYQRDYLTAQSSYESEKKKAKLSEEALNTALQKWAKLEKILKEGPLNIAVLEDDIETLESVIKQLQTDIKNGAFEYKGKTLKLGDVKAELDAKTTTLNTLSANLKNKLATIEGQISQKEKDITSIRKKIDSIQDQIDDLRSDYNKYKKQKNKIKTAYYFALIQTAVLKLSYQENKLDDTYDDLRELRDDKSDAKSAVDKTKSEQSALRKKVELGEKELERKKGALTNKGSELTLMQSQLEKQKTELETAKKEFSANKDFYTMAGKIKSYKDQMVSYAASISSLATQYGYTEITNTNSERTYQYLQEEYEFIKAQDDAVYITAIGQTGNITSIVVSLFPGVGEGYDVLTLLHGSDPITKETLTPFTTALTVIGLLSGAGSGKVARELVMEGLEDLAKNLDLTFDELLPIAEKVAKNYKFDSLDSLIELKEKLSLDKFLDEVETAAKEYKNSLVDELDELSDGTKVLETITEFSLKQIDEYATLGTKNEGKSKVLLGKSDDGKSTGYVAQAGKDYTYFNLGDKWDELYNLVNKNKDEMWRINKKFIDNEKAAGKEFYLSHDPSTTAAGSYYDREVQYLTKPVSEGGLGGTIVDLENNLWQIIW